MWTGLFATQVNAEGRRVRITFKNGTVFEYDEDDVAHVEHLPDETPLDKAPLRRRAQEYVQAFETGDTDALLNMVSPTVIDELKEDGPESIELFKSALGMGVTMLQNAKEAGAVVTMEVGDIDVEGDTAVVKLNTRIVHDGEAKNREDKLHWERIRGVWYLRP